MARITRKELKTDRFALEVGQTVTFFEEHQKEIIRYGAAAAVVIALVFGYVVYQRHQSAAREEALYRAIQIQESSVGPPTPGMNVNFPTQDSKDQAATVAFTAIQKQDPGTKEGEIAEYYLGCIKSDQGKLSDAEKSFLEVADKGDANYASLARLSLAQIYFADGRTAQAEKLLRDLMAHPTLFVSKDQAAITLARDLLYRNPAEARKLLDPLRQVQGNVGQVALQLYSQLPAK